MTVVSAIGSEVTKSIWKACDEVERTWEEVLELFQLIPSKKESELILYKILSFNPSNTIVSKNPKTSSAISEINDIVLRLSDSIQADPHNYTNWVSLGHCYLLMHDHPNAYTAYTHALSLTQQNEIQDPNFWLGIGSVYQYFKYNASIVFLRHADTIPTDSPLYSDLQFRIALANRDTGNYQKALEIFTDLIQSPPPDLLSDDILLHIAFTYQLDHQTTKATETYEALYQRHPDSLDLIQQYAWFLSLQNDPISLNKVDSLILQFNNDSTLKLISARIAMKRQDMTTAYHNYCDCITYWSDSPLFWCGLGVLYFKNDQMRDAVIAFQRALYLRGDIYEAWANLGLILELQEQPKNAFNIYQASIKQCPNSELLRERYHALESGRSRQPTPAMVLEINDSNYFTQAVERISEEYVALPPAIEIKDLDKHSQEVLREFTLKPKSIF
ncbi:TPR Domain containing protein [Histomonas meleagridis]|uniref:TPR Domain containing protein n=1 Tax=Histomonas meleagridis TaxID=135588 RepID=UPI00355A6263|nr:TPR Domain containing protein [Histomonas meleagridis]KAH0800294.1 TPR Domain containing protein [Histomonas meleagridis]